MRGRNLPSTVYTFDNACLFIDVVRTRRRRALQSITESQLEILLSRSDGVQGSVRCQQTARCLAGSLESLFRIRFIVVRDLGSAAIYIYIYIYIYGTAVCAWVAENVISQSNFIQMHGTLRLRDAWRHKTWPLNSAYNESAIKRHSHTHTHTYKRVPMWFGLNYLVEMIAMNTKHRERILKQVRPSPWIIHYMILRMKQRIFQEHI